MTNKRLTITDYKRLALKLELTERELLQTKQKLWLAGKQIKKQKLKLYENMRKHDMVEMTNKELQDHVDDLIRQLHERSQYQRM